MNTITGKKQICLGSLCVNGGQLTQALLAKQLREVAEKNAPVTAGSSNLFAITSTLPGKPFRPALLDLRGAASDAIIPPGDYLVPVKAFCLQKRAASPPGHRYVLGQYGGKRQKVLTALNQAIPASGMEHRDLQNLSWAIQAGVSYQDMPQEMKAQVDQLIPDHRSSLNREFLEEIEKVWSVGSQALNLPSFETFLERELGDVGKGIIAYREVRNRLINQGQDWRNLSDLFLIDDGTQASGDILNTPWSQVGEGVHARFLTQGSAGDTGFLLLRIDESASNKTKILPAAAVTIISGGLAVYDLYSLITSLMALPEGNQNIQPLAMSPDPNALKNFDIDAPDSPIPSRTTKCVTRNLRAKFLCTIAESLKVVKPSSKRNRPIEEVADGTSNANRNTSPIKNGEDVNNASDRNGRRNSSNDRSGNSGNKWTDDEGNIIWPHNRGFLGAPRRNCCNQV